MSGVWPFSLTFSGATYWLLEPLLTAFRLTNGEMPFFGEKVVPWAKEFPTLWDIITKSFPALILATGFIIGWYIYQMFFADWLETSTEPDLAVEDVELPRFPWNCETLQLIVGLQHDPYSMAFARRPKYLLLDEKALFQNILITGTIGTGKTQGVMYPFLKQAIFHQASNLVQKAGMLVLDVKGNFYQEVLEYARACGREDDVIPITLGGHYLYNPLHKPRMEAIDLAERSRLVMDMFNSGGKKDAFWDTKAAQMMTECIRLLRCCLNYCTLGDVHRLVTNKTYLKNMLDLLDLLMDLQSLKQIIEKPVLKLLKAYILERRDIFVQLTTDQNREGVERALTGTSENDSDSLQNLRQICNAYYLNLVLNIVLFIEDCFGLNVLSGTQASKVRDDGSHFPSDILDADGNIRADVTESLLRYAENLPHISEFDYDTCRTYFSGEFSSKAETTVETIKTVVTQMTSFFVSSERIAAAFCPPEDKLNFFGFEEAINKGKIVVLAMNVAAYPQVSRTIAAYLKQDFQAEIQQRTAPGGRLHRSRPMFFFCDEYQEYVTANDGNFYGVSREAKCCSIVATQSYTSLLKALHGDRPAFDTLIQNMISKIALRSDDKLTIDIMQMLVGKVEKTRTSKNISESASDSQKSGLFGGLVSSRASLSESINISTQKEALFEERDFTQTLLPLKAIAFLAAEAGMQKPTMVHLLPAFGEQITSIR